MCFWLWCIDVVVLTRLPTQKASALAELLPHNWVSTGKA